MAVIICQSQAAHLNGWVNNCLHGAGFAFGGSVVVTRQNGGCMSGHKKPKKMGLDMFNECPQKFSDWYLGADWQVARDFRKKEIESLAVEFEKCTNEYFSMKESIPDGHVLTETESLLLEVALLRYTLATERYQSALKISSLYQQVNLPRVHGSGGGDKAALSNVVSQSMQNIFKPMWVEYEHERQTLPKKDRKYGTFKDLVTAYQLKDQHNSAGEPSLKNYVAKLEQSQN